MNQPREKSENTTAFLTLISHQLEKSSFCTNSKHQFITPRGTSPKATLDTKRYGFSESTHLLPAEFLALEKLARVLLGPLLQRKPVKCMIDLDAASVGTGGEGTKYGKLATKCGKLGTKCGKMGCAVLSISCFEFRVSGFRFAISRVSG